MVKLTTGRLDESILAMKNLPFIHEYVRESVSTRLKSHAVNISTAYPHPADQLVRTYACETCALWFLSAQRPFS